MDNIELGISKKELCCELMHLNLKRLCHHYLERNNKLNLKYYKSLSVKSVFSTQQLYLMVPDIILRYSMNLYCRVIFQG